MSAYDKLGLAMIPSGYKGEADENNAGGFLGKVYSVLPAQTTSDNLVTNGTFDVDSDWTIESTWTISNGVANGNGANGNAQELVSDSTGVEAGLYEVSFEIKNYSSGEVIPYFYGATQSFSGDGVYTFTKTNDGVAGIKFRGVNFNGSIDNVSLKRIINGDFDFSRGSDATRVNSQGYIESVQVLSDELVQNGDFEQIGSELVTNGNFATDSDWTLGSDTTISDSKLIINNQTGGNIQTSQNDVVVVGNFYKVVFTISDYTSGEFRLFNTFDDFTTYNSNGTYTVYAKAYLGTTLNLFSNANSQYSIDNISVKEVGQNWTFGTGWSIEDDGGNLKAIVDNTVNASLDQTCLTSQTKYKVSFEISDLQVGGNIIVGDIVTPSSYTATENGIHTFQYTATNNTLRVRGKGYPCSIDNISVVEVTDDTDIPRLDYSDGACPSLLLEPQRTNNILNSENITNASLVNSSLEGGYSAPDGSNNAVRFFCDPSNKSVAYATLGANNSTVPTDARSIYARTVSGTGTVSLCSYYQNTNNTFTITEDWQRFEVLGTTTTSGASNFYAVDFRLGTSTSTEVILWAPQSEQGSYATSYIPTNGQAETRLADVCTGGGDSNVFNDSEGVLYAEMSTEFEGSSGVKALSVQYDGNNYLSIYFRDNNSLSARVVGSGNVTQVDTSYATNTLYKIAVSYNSTNVKFYVNGTQVDIETTNTIPTSLNKLSFDRGGELATNMNGNIKSLLYFNEALTDEELQTLTTI